MNLFHRPDTTDTTPDIDQPAISTTRRLAVTGMTCSHCERAIAAELSTVAGIVTVDVDAVTGIVTIGCSSEPDPATISAAVHDAGYDLR